MQQTDHYAVSTLGLGLVAAALARSFSIYGGQESLRGMLLLGLPCAVLLVLSGALAGALARHYGLFEGNSWWSRWVGLGFLAWFGAELFWTVGQAQMVCRQQFSSNALVGVLPILLLVCWGQRPQALNHTARVLWWLFGLAAVGCLLGLSSQMQWQRMYSPSAPGLLQEGLPVLELRPEYFALPLLCSERRQSSGALLPLWSFGVQALYALAVELVLGRQRSTGYSGLELLRAWSLGSFSRMDALLILVWLAAALFRICFLVCVMRRIFDKCLAGKTAKGENRA